MDFNKETLELSKTDNTGQEVIKTQIAFKKGLLAGVLIMILILSIGVLIGYGIGQYITSNHYIALMAEQAEKCLILN